MDSFELTLFDASEAAEFNKTKSRRPDQTLASSGGGELSAGHEKSAEIRPLSTLSRGEAPRLEGGREHVENTDISVLGGERDCISSFQRSATTKAISLLRPQIAIARGMEIEYSGRQKPLAFYYQAPGGV